MNDLKINRDKPELSDDQILKHKNFDDLMKAAKPVTVPKKPWYQTGGFIWGAGILGIAIIASIVWLPGMMNEELEQTTQEPVVETENPVVEGLDKEKLTEAFNTILSSVPVDQNKFPFDLGDDRFIILNRLSEVPFSFELKQEESQEFDRKSEYTDVKVISVALFSQESEFDPPTQYADTLGFNGNLEIKLNSEKADVYTHNGTNWEKLELIQQEEVQQVEQPVKEEKLKPVKSVWPPFVFDESDYDVSSKLDEFPELDGYSNVLFEPVGDFDPMWLETNWDDFKLEKLDGQYTITLFKNNGKVQKQCKVNIAFAEEDYQKAMQTYQESLEEEAPVNVSVHSYYLIDKAGKYAICYK